MKRLNNRGQSTIEFVLTCAFSISILLLLITAGLFYSSGYLVHYATYMSSRAFLVGDDHFVNQDPTDSMALENAKIVFSRMDIDEFGLTTVENKCPAFNLPGSAKYVYVGTYCSWISVMSAAGVFGNKKLNMLSESFLGREPTRADCAKNICNSMGKDDNCSDDFTTLYDNGC